MPQVSEAEKFFKENFLEFLEEIITTAYKLFNFFPQGFNRLFFLFGAINCCFILLFH